MNFKSVFHNITEKVTETVNHFQGTVYDILNREKVNVNDLANFIKDHPITNKITKKLLDITLNDYKLSINDVQFLMETRGEGDTEKVLSVTVVNNSKLIVKYRSYDPASSKGLKISFPEFITT